jgi:hypothetical protein
MIPGLILFLVIGGGMLVAGALAVGGSGHAARASLAMGITVLGFVIVETTLIRYQGAQQIRLLVLVAAPALVLVAVGWRFSCPTSV